MSLSMHIAALFPDPRVQRAKKQTGIARKTAIVPDPPHEVRQHYAVFERWHSGFPIFSITQMVFGDSQSAEAQEYDPNAPALDELTPQQTAKRAVLYIPGGDFSDYMPTAAWRFVTDLVDAGLRVDIPLSGRLPDYTAREAVPLVRRAYQDLLKEHGAENITIIADGSGAALAIGSLLAFLPDACPSNVILADPWYDLVASGWQQEHTGKVASYLKEVSHRWAGGQLNNAKVNPGVMGRQEWRQWAGSAFHIFVGGHSQPMRDARRLEKDLKNAGVAVNVTRVEGTVYMYHLHRTSEGRRDRRQMIRIAQGQES